MAITTDAETIQWLKHFGYLETEHPTIHQHNDAVARMQKVYGLVEDAIAGPVTRRAMGLFRCARPDHAIASGRKALRVDDKHCKWQKKVITYAIGSSFQLAGSRNQSIEILRQGFRIYEPLTGLSFVEHNNWNEADIRIGRARGRRWDFDGPGNVLAWAQMPCADVDVQLLTMFDDSEPWNLKTTGPGVIMLAVWLHELGHLLGLDHSDSEFDLMAPYYNPQIIMPQAGDRRRLARVYDLATPQDTGAPDQPVPGLPFGAYNGEASLVLRDDGGVAINLKNLQTG